MKLLNRLICPSCGASISIEQGAIRTVCEYCDSLIEVEYDYKDIQNKKIEAEIAKIDDFLKDCKDYQMCEKEHYRIQGLINQIPDRSVMTVTVIKWIIVAIFGVTALMGFTSYDDFISRFIHFIICVSIAGGAYYFGGIIEEKTKVEVSENNEKKESLNNEYQECITKMNEIKDRITHNELSRFQRSEEDVIKIKSFLINKKCSTVSEAIVLALNSGDVKLVGEFKGGYVGSYNYSEGNKVAEDLGTAAAVAGMAIIGSKVIKDVVKDFIDI